jgi:iron(III) transport system substrate-binding protein
MFANPRLSRRDLLRASALGALASVSARVLAAAPEPTPVTPGLIEAARREGKFAWYAALDLPIAEKIARAFEGKYPGIACRVERSGAERIFQRLGQEYASRIHAADVIESADASHFIVWKRAGWLAPYVPDDVATRYPADHKDPDGMFATWRLGFSIIGYNTNLVKPEEAPKSFADLLDPKWTGRLVKAHPAYSGTILTATFQIARELGWPYFERLAKQAVMQVQSANDSPKKVAVGERAVMVDGNEHQLIRLREAGQPVEAAYPLEGAPLIVSPAGVLKNAPNPNAARLFQSWLFSAEAQQLVVDLSGLHSVHPLVREKPGRMPFRDIKAMKDDPAAVEAQREEIKARYTKYFKV